MTYDYDRTDVPLRKKIIRLAYEKPELREHLLPLIKAAADAPKFRVGDVITWKSTWYEGNWTVVSVRPWVHGTEYGIKKPKGRSIPMFFDKRDSTFLFDNREIEPRRGPKKSAAQEKMLYTVNINVPKDSAKES